MPSRLALAVVAAVVVTALPAHTQAISAPRYDPTFDEVIGRADLVVAGELDWSTTRETGRVVIQRHGVGLPLVAKVGLLKVDRVIKGKADSSISLRFDSLDDRGAINIVDGDLFRFVPPQRYSVFLLKKAGTEYELLNEDLRPFTADRVTGPLQGTAADQVSVLIGAVLSSTSNAPSSIKDEAIITLAWSTSRAAHDALAAALADPDPEVRFRAASFLMSHKDDLTVLPMVEDALLHPKADIPEVCRDMLRSGLEGLRNAAAIPALSRLSRAPDVATRRAAMRGLRFIRSPDALGALAEGLSDTDIDTLYAATAGLAEITKGPLVSMNQFRRDKDQIIAYWKDWARARGLIK